MNTQPPYRAWVEVDTDAIVHNLKIAHEAAETHFLMPIIKANAYGHGMETVAKALDNVPCVRYFGVANVAEAQRLKEAKTRNQPFILGPTLPDEREEILRNGWGCTVSTLDEINHFEEMAAGGIGDGLGLHLALDTGMGREGFMPADLPKIAQRATKLKHVRIEGIMSHYSAADEDADFTKDQQNYFAQCCRELKRALLIDHIHIAASAGVLGFSAGNATMARPGIMLYGVAPVESRLSSRLKPALRLLSRVVLLRDLPAGHTVSYGNTYTTTAPTRVATIGIGYADGWPRSTGGQGASVYIRGVQCPILGRVTMDLIMADVSQVPEVEVGDEVELIGPNQPVTRVAQWAGTIPWEIFTGLGVRLPRIPKAKGMTNDE